MLMLISNLGSDYIVWDKAGHIRFRMPGKGKVRAEFRLTEAELADIREQMKTVPKFVVSDLTQFSRRPCCSTLGPRLQFAQQLSTRTMTPPLRERRA